MVIPKISHGATNTCDNDTAPTILDLHPQEGKEKTSSKLTGLQWLEQKHRPVFAASAFGFATQVVLE